jgi:predicted aspartyl protease
VRDVAFQLPSFRQRYIYSSPAITVPLILKPGGQRVDCLAKVDTGADFCLFDREYAEALSIEVERGTPTPFQTANSSFTAYGHALSLAVLGIEFDSVVYSFEDSAIRKNVVGRLGWLDRIRLAVVHHDSTLYLNAYDEA